MLHQDDLKWIAKTSTELNTVLQQIARYAELAKRHKGDQDYIEQLNQQVEIASRSAQALFDRVTSKILENTSGKTLPPSETSASAPVAVGDAPDVISPGTATPSQIAILNPEGGRELILIIDDEPEIAEFASTILAEEGYKVIVARDGFEALKIFQQIHDQIGLIILDFFLPVMDGDAVFEELKGINPSVNVVLSSGFAEQNKIGAMLAQGLRGFIPKPYTREKLLEQVQSAIEASHRPIL
jgi:CheY-like chemotaxis protein